MLKQDELFSDTLTLGRRVNWTNTLRNWVLETPCVFPYFRSWYQGKVVADFVTHYEAQNVSGLVTNNPEALKKTLGAIREIAPNYNPIAMVDPQSESLYCVMAERDKKIVSTEEGGTGLPKEIVALLYNRSRTRGGFSLKTGDYNQALKTLYDPKTCGGWIYDIMRKGLEAGGKVGIPMLPLIVDDESKRSWKDAYLSLKKLAVEPENLEGEIGIPLALHIPVHRSIFRERNKDLAEEIVEEVEELKPTAVTVKLADTKQGLDSARPEEETNIRNFLENIGRTCKAAGVPTHLFSENNRGIVSFKLGFSSFSQPVDFKPMRKDFYPQTPPTPEERYGRIYHYKLKQHVLHSAWLNEAESIQHAPCDLKCCKNITFDVLKRMTWHEFWRYAWKHLLATRELEVSEVIQAIQSKTLKQHLIAKSFEQ